jgi:hypothetical protein
MRLAEKSLEALDLDQARFAEDLKLHQQDFATTVDNLAVVCGSMGIFCVTSLTCHH